MISRIRKVSPFRRRRVSSLVWLGALAAGTLMLVDVPPARALFGGLDPIIFDPTNFAAHIKQFQQLVQQVQQAQTEIANQLKSLASLPKVETLTTALPQQFQQVKGQLHSAVYQAQDVRATLDQLFPRELPNLSSADYQQLQAQWTQSYRDALTENRQLENEVYRQMRPTSQQVQEIIAASNAAPGEKAAVQAHNDLVATLSGELAKLEMVRASRLRAKAEKSARLQSEDAYGRAQGQAVLRGMGEHTQSSTPITGFFQDQ